LALLAGLLFSNFPKVVSRLKPLLDFAAKRLLRIGVALLGFQITFHKFADIGLKGFIAILFIVVFTFISVRKSAKYFGISPELALLIAGGFSICGASAVTAIGASKKSRNEDVSYAVGIVTLCGTLSIFAIPPIAKALHLSHRIAGAWIGAAVHDIGQVIATASVVGGTSLSYAVISKLARVVLLAPLLVLINLKGDTTSVSRSKFSITAWLPPFILAFIVITIFNNEVHVSPHTTNLLINISKVLLSVGLFAMASSVSWRDIRVIGAKPLIFGLSAWVICGGFSLLVIRLI
jgi:uncharacterized integral membrane protein (TIGR00698 family)